MDTIGVTCKSCGKRLLFAKQAGTIGKCSVCGATQQITDLSALPDKQSLPAGGAAARSCGKPQLAVHPPRDSALASARKPIQKTPTLPEALPLAVPAASHGRRFIYAKDYRVKGERAVLAISIIVVLFVFLILLELSFGLALVLVVVLAIYVKAKQKQMLGNLARVSREQFPEVYNALCIAAERLGMDPPDVFVQQDPYINAFAIGFFGKNSVVLHSALVEAMNRDEILYIVGHEFSHVKCGHTGWGQLAGSGGSVAIPVVSQVMTLIFLAWSRKAEYTCDRGGLLACGDVRAALTAPAKVSVGKQLFEKLNIERFFDQKSIVDKDNLAGLSEALGDHPYVVNRMQALVEFSRSQLYAELSAR